MKAIVTGGTGFIGSHLVDALCAMGYQVGVIDRVPPSEYWDFPAAASYMALDVASPEAETFIADFAPDVVFHMAAQASVPASIDNPVEDARTTLIGLIRVLEGARRGGARKVVYSSSAAVYGDPDIELPIPEDTPLSPISPYGATKAAGESYLAMYSNLYGLTYAALRYANVYGPRQGLSGEGGVVAIFGSRFVRNQPIHLFGDGRHTRDYVYVGDIVRANLRAAEYASNIVCNVSTGKQTSNLELIEALQRAAGTVVPVLHEPERAGDIRYNALCGARAAAQLHFQPETELEHGIAETLAWMRQQKGHE